MYKNCKNNQSGQTLIMMIMVMSIALFIGITISYRFINSLRSITATDNLAKAQAIAEAGVERILALSSATLSDYINNNSCGSDCTVTITDSNGQVLSAHIALSFTGSGGTLFQTKLDESDSYEVFLQGYTAGEDVYVCWNSQESVVGSYIYSESGTIKSTPFAYNATTTAHPENFFQNSSSNFGYQSCFTVVASNTPLALRLRSVYGDPDIYVLPEPGRTLPVQGILIKSTGSAGDARKTVSVIKTNSYAPVIFDYAIYQRNDSDALSN